MIGRKVYEANSDKLIQVDSLIFVPLKDIKEIPDEFYKDGTVVQFKVDEEECSYAHHICLKSREVVYYAI
jgi:hypothetical protein